MIVLNVPIAPIYLPGILPVLNPYAHYRMIYMNTSKSKNALAKSNLSLNAFSEEESIFDSLFISMHNAMQSKNASNIHNVSDQ